jgi:AcrR family transcriptional regulator
MLNTRRMTEVTSGRRSGLKRPSQARSIATFSSILAASTDVIVERGVQGLNTNIVAERAGVNIGTVYHYFPDKTAILVELFRIDQQRRMAHVLEKLREIEHADDLDQWAEDIFNLMLELRSDHPATTQLRRAFRAVPELVEIDRKENEEYLDFFSVLLHERFSNMSRERARAAARLLIEITATVLDVSQETDELADEFITEGKIALKGYLHSLAHQ